MGTCLVTPRKPAVLCAMSRLVCRRIAPQNLVLQNSETVVLDCNIHQNLSNYPEEAGQSRDHAALRARMLGYFAVPQIDCPATTTFARPTGTLPACDQTRCRCMRCTRSLHAVHTICSGCSSHQQLAHRVGHRIQAQTLPALAPHKALHPPDKTCDVKPHSQLKHLPCP